MSRKWDCTSACVPLLKERKVQSKAPAASMQLQKKGAMQQVHRASKRKTLTCLLVGYCIIRCSSCILEWQSYIPLKGTTYTPARCVVHFYFFPRSNRRGRGANTYRILYLYQLYARILCTHAEARDDYGERTIPAGIQCCVAGFLNFKYSYFQDRLSVP